MTHDTDPKPISKEWNYHPDLLLVISFAMTTADSNNL